MIKEQLLVAVFLLETGLSIIMVLLLGNFRL